MHAMEKQSTLVLTAGSLGDALLTLPALRLLQSRAEITVAGTSPYQSLGVDLLGISGVVSLEPLLQALLSGSPLEPSHQTFLKRFHDIYLFFKEKDGRLLEKLAALSGGNSRHHIRSVFHTLARMKAARITGNTLYDETRVFIDQNAHIKFRG